MGAAQDAVQLPASMQVFERGWLSSNNILFCGPGETALVDSGYVSHASQTLALVRQVLGARRLDMLVTTHLHSDHCGGNALLQSTYGSRTVIPRAEADLVANWRAEDFNAAQTGQRLDRFRFDATLAPGETLVLGGLEWKALGAPGHDLHALMLYCPDEKILISADALWQEGFGVIFPELEGRPGFEDTQATLDSIAALPVRIVIPGHGAPFTDVGAALARAYARLQYLREDPARNARHAVKVLLKFLLLDEQALALADLPRRFSTIRLVAAINERFMHLAEDALCQWTVEALVAIGAARIAGPLLVNAEPRAGSPSTDQDGRMSIWAAILDQTAGALGSAPEAPLQIAGVAAFEPWFLTLHILGIVCVVGAVVVMDLRLLGLGRALPVRALHGFVIPFALAALLVAVPSGLALFALHATRLIGEPAFFYKMLLLFAAAINALIFYTGTYQGSSDWDPAGPPPAAARWAAILSLLIWIAVVYCGQSLAHGKL